LRCFSEISEILADAYVQNHRIFELVPLPEITAIIDGSKKKSESFFSLLKSEPGTLLGKVAEAAVGFDD
jgi:hypothetical protein